MSSPIEPLLPVPAIVAPAPVDHAKVLTAIKTAWRAFSEAGSRSVSHLRSIGQMLRQIKQQPPPGTTFDAWVEANTEIKPRMAYYYIKLDKDWVEGCENATSLADALRVIQQSKANGDDEGDADAAIVELNDDDKATMVELLRGVGVELAADAITHALVDGFGFTPRTIKGKLAERRKERTERLNAEKEKKAAEYDMIAAELAEAKAQLAKAEPEKYKRSKK